jgi:type IV fimbrial biogenesis protein FimT
MHRPSIQRGFTMLETSIVLATVGVLAGAALPSLQGLLQDRRVNGAAAQLAADLHLIRTEAVMRNETVRMSFYTSLETNCYVIHTGAAAQCACDMSGPAVCSGGADQIKTVRLDASQGPRVQSNVGSIAFNPMHGTSTPTATVRIVGALGREVRHVVNILGRVRSCAPEGAVTGYKPC